MTSSELFLRGLKKFDQSLESLCKQILVLSVWGMLILCLMNIICRFFHVTFLWTDPLIRHLVFLSIFLGGVLASGSRQNIAIDVFIKIL